MSFALKTRVAGNCPKLGGTADKHIRPCHVDGRAFLYVLVKGVVMKQSFNTSKLYYGFPVFILGYQD